MHDTDLPTIEKRLRTLEDRIAKTAVKSKSRLTLTIAVMACLLVGAFFYLRFLSTSITTAADAPTLVQLVADQLEPRLQQAPAQLTESLKLQAPMVVDSSEKIILDALPEALDQADDFVISFFEKEFEEIEKKAYDVIHDGFNDVITRAKEKKIDLAKDGELEREVGQIAPNLRQMIESIIEENIDEFKSGTNEISAYISRLSTDEDLTDHEKAHREIMISGIALIRKIENDPSRSPIGSLLQGDLPNNQKPSSAID
ncbi:MAG: hypothetical protein HN985_04360 [Planctomycetaceae bacterium]|nr:hypothetical protein [Planctomycetaceae bacterium]MBT6055155.1 hypothetical protein [Planctomycetaceae bacterium]MBT6918936.1 hypothetical protein [Planctomycetaceae bacterium]